MVYKVVDNQWFHYNTAVTKCTDIGGLLPEPRNQVENNFLMTLTMDRFWLGIDDRAISNRYVYKSDNSLVTWTQWGPGLPVNTGDNCVTLWRDNGATDRYWKHISGGARKDNFSLVCQLKRELSDIL